MTEQAKALAAKTTRRVWAGVFMQGSRVAGGVGIAATHDPVLDGGEVIPATDPPRRPAQRQASPQSGNAPPPESSRKM